MDNKSIPKKGNGLKVNLDFEVYNVSIDENKSILEILLDENIDAPHSCLGGICSTCIAKVKSGETEMKEKITVMQTEVLIKQEANLKDLGEMLTTIICHKTNDIKEDTNALKHELLKELKSVRDSTLTAKISHFFSREVTEAAELNKDVLQADLEKLCSPPASAPDT